MPSDTVSSLSGGAILLSIVVAIAAFFAVGLRGSSALGRQGIRQLTTNSQFPAIQMLQGQGWQIGERPAQ